MADEHGSDSKKRKHAGRGSSSNGFKSLGLSDPVYRGIVRMGFRMPTPVQRKALPVALSGVDTVVMARTGSGKTCAFLIPLMEKLLATPKGQHGSHVRGIILSPTRELSLQTLKVLNKLSADTEIRAVGIHGGEGMEKQFSLLASKPDIVVASPGRFAHHLSEIPDFNLSGCMMCILDEADRLVEMGFAQQIRLIARSLPETCQKLLFSATMPKVLIEFTKSGFAVDPTVVRLDQEATVSADLRIAFITCRSLDKDAALLHILHQIREDQEAHPDSRTGLSLIFAATRHHVEYISTLLTASGLDTTMIYGSMDQEARKSNLAAFRSGKKSVLVVTDVAARGIDVPLIDHVIHYHFPPSPKLFVHRSGRAARAGRIGFCWSLVEPDEMAYMIDLHLFLGRRPSTGEDKEQEPCGQTMYTLNEMTPEMVHFGSVPESVLTQEVENVQRIVNSELSGSLQSESLRALMKVCNNAMKQYRRTRAEASREGIRRGKAILEGERLESGQRIGGGAILPHPLLRCIEKKRQESHQGLGDDENVREREKFLRAMSNFRPKETVFEAFGTSGTKDVGVVSHVDKGRTTSNKKHDSGVALTAMKNMRRQMRMARDKGSALMVAGSAVSESANGEGDKVGDEKDDNLEAKLKNHDLIVENEPTSLGTLQTKRRMSRAERRRLKKNPNSAAVALASTKSVDHPTKLKRKSDFRDPTFFIKNDFTVNTEEAQRSRQIETAMQPSTTSSVKGSVAQALRIEEAMLDLLGDENDDLVKKQRLMRWDKSKRKYVRTTVGAELNGESKSKKMRLESGQLVKSDKMKLGELYEKWQKKTNRSIGRSGVFDDADDAIAMKTKTSADIKKERQMKKNMALKNMKRSERRTFERKEREARFQKKSKPGRH